MLWLPPPRSGPVICHLQWTRTCVVEGEKGDKRWLGWGHHKAKNLHHSSLNLLQLVTTAEEEQRRVSVKRRDESRHPHQVVVAMRRDHCHTMFNGQLCVVYRYQIIIIVQKNL